MIYELFLEGELADIRQDLGMQLNYNIDDINKYGSRDTSFSKTIVLPGTAKNNRLLGFVGELGSFNPYTAGSANINSNFNAAQTTKAELRANGLLLLKGVFRLTGIVKDMDMIEYEGNLFGELGGFIAAIGGKKIEQLDFSNYNHVYNRDNIVNSWNGIIEFSALATFTNNLSGPGSVIFIIDIPATLPIFPVGTTFNVSESQSNNKIFTIVSHNYNAITKLHSYVVSQSVTVDATFKQVKFTGLRQTTASEYGNGYYYPLIDYGRYSTDKKDYDYRTFRPALFVKEYVDKIFEESGYVYESNFFNSAFFKKLIIPCNLSKLTKKTSDLFLGYRTKINLLNQSSNVVSPFWLGYNNIIYNFFTIEYNGGNANYPFYRYTSPEAVNIKIEYKIKAFIQYATWPSNHRFRYGVRKNGQNITYKEIFRAREGSGNIIQLRNYSLDDTINVEISLQQNDYLEFPIEIQNVETGSYIESGSLDIKSTNPVTVDIQLNDPIILNSLIPRNILQVDFFTWLVKMFNLYVTEDKIKSNHLLIEPYKDYYDLNNSIDWTYKVARDKPWQIKPMGMLNGRFFEYKFKDDNDYYNENFRKKFGMSYGDLLEDTGFQFAKQKQTLEVGFSPSVLVQYSGTDKIVAAIYKLTKGNSVEQEEWIESNIRIMMVKKITGISNWTIRNKGATLGQNPGTALGASLTAYGYAGHFDDPVNPTVDINFGAASEIYFDPVTYPSANLFNEYWSAYIAEIADKDSKILSCHVYLTDLDIAKLDFSKPVFIDGVLWRINKIIDFDASSGELTKVELLKVINNG